MDIIIQIKNVLKRLHKGIKIILKKLKSLPVALSLVFPRVIIKIQLLIQKINTYYL